MYAQSSSIFWSNNCWNQSSLNSLPGPFRRVSLGIYLGSETSVINILGNSLTLIEYVISMQKTSLKNSLYLRQRSTVQWMYSYWSFGEITRKKSKEGLSCANKGSLDVLPTGLRSLHYSWNIYFLYQELIKVKHEIIRADPPGFLLACCLLGHGLNLSVFTVLFFFFFLFLKIFEKVEVMPILNMISIIKTVTDVWGLVWGGKHVKIDHSSLVLTEKISLLICTWLLMGLPPRICSLHIY